MSDNSPPATSAGTATAVAEPPGPPGAPPTTATAAPAPRRRGRRWLGWVIGILIVVIVIGALVGVVVWATRGRSTAATGFSAYAEGFDSAMVKAGTSAKFPGAPVELTGVTATGSHPFSATFTADEVTALLNVFAWTTDIQATSVAVSGVRVGFPKAGTASLRAGVTLNGASYNGTLSGPVQYRDGAIVSAGETTVIAEGIPIGGERGTQATNMLLVYLNGYLAAAPGLSVTTAEITDTGVRVTGTAPDALTLP